MKELSIQELEDKIKMIQEDITRSLTDKGREALTMYLDYLKDELNELKKREKAS